MIKKYKIKCNLFWNQINYLENDEIEIEESLAKKYPYFFEEIKNNPDSKKISTKSRNIKRKNKND